MYTLIVFLIVILAVFIIVGICWSFKRQTDCGNNLKFFNEIPGYTHLDARYGKKNVENVQKELLYMLSDFMRYCDQHDIKPILYAGSLLGWYRNKKLLPWDDDLDLIILSKDVPKLQPFETKDCILEINPHAWCRSIKDHNNKIDARYINKHNGLFIDLVFLYPNGNKLCTKFSHDRIEQDDLIPIVKSNINNIPVYIPNQPQKVLFDLYGDRCMKDCGHGPPGNTDWCFTGNGWVSNS